MPDTKKVKDLTINKFGSVDAYKYAKQNGLIGNDDVNVLSPDAVPSGGGGGYVLTEEDKNEIAEIAAGMVDVPEGGGGSDGVLDTGFLYDSGEIVLPVNTVTVDTGLRYTDLAKWDKFYVRVAVVNAPWEGLSPRLYFVNHVATTATDFGSTMKRIWYFDRIADMTYTCIGVNGNNGNLGDLPPSAGNVYDFGNISKMAYATTRMVPDDDNYIDATLKVYIPAQTKDFNIRVIVGGLKRRGE